MLTSRSRVLRSVFHERFDAYMMRVGLDSPSLMTFNTSTAIWKLDLRGLNAMMLKTD